MSCNLNNITHNSTCGRKFACSTSVKHCIAQYIAMYKHCIEYIIDIVQRMFRCQHKRCYQCTVTVSCLIAGSKKFDTSSQCFRVFDIGCCNLCDSFCMDVLEINLLPTYQRCENRNLSAGIMSLDISGRICFCISFLLCIFQYIFELRTF